MQTSKKIIALVAAVVVLAAAGGGIWLHHRKTAETESAAAVYVSTVAELNAANPDLTTLWQNLWSYSPKTLPHWVGSLSEVGLPMFQSADMLYGSIIAICTACSILV